MKSLRKTSRLLIDDHPLQVLPSLATAIGLNEALFIQQLHYWLTGKSHERDNRLWVYNTYESWHEQFPFWSIPTIRRVVASLRDMGLIITTDEYNRLGYDNTLWYTIDYDVLNTISDTEKACDQSDQRPCDQNDQTTRSNRSEGVINVIRPIPETTTETTTETKREEEEEARARTHDPRLESVFTAWRENMPQRLTPLLEEKIKEQVSNCGAGSFLHGIMAAVESGSDKQNFRYVSACAESFASGEPRRTRPPAHQSSRRASRAYEPARRNYRPDEYSDIILG